MWYPNFQLSLRFRCISSFSMVSSRSYRLQGAANILCLMVLAFLLTLSWQLVGFQCSSCRTSKKLLAAYTEVSPVNPCKRKATSLEQNHIRVMKFHQVKSGETLKHKNLHQVAFWCFFLSRTYWGCDQRMIDKLMLEQFTDETLKWMASWYTAVAATATEPALLCHI